MTERKNTKESMDYGKVRKEEYKGKYGLWKGRKGRIQRKVWIMERSERKNTKESMDYGKVGKEEFYRKYG